MKCLIVKTGDMDRSIKEMFNLQAEFFKTAAGRAFSALPVFVVDYRRFISGQRLKIKGERRLVSCFGFCQNNSRHPLSGSLINIMLYFLNIDEL